MKTGLAVVAVLGLCACGAPFTPVASCQVGGLDFEFQSASDANCAYFQKLADDVTGVLVADFASRDEVQKISAGQVFYVHTGRMLTCSTAPSAACMSGSSVDLDETGAGLMFSLLTRLGEARHYDGNDVQRDWGTRGATATAPLMTYDGHTELPGSWWNIADNSTQVWTNLHVYDSWETFPMPATVSSTREPF